MPRSAAASIDSIAVAAERVLLSQGLGGLSLEQVAREAGCAKGLVNYHFRTKDRLLAAVAVRLADRRRERLLTALEAEGTAALDALWEALRHAAVSGETAGRLALLGLREPDVARPLAERVEQWPDLAVRLAAVLEVDAVDPESVRALLAAFDGLELSLLAGADEEETRAGFYRVVLALTD